MVHKLSAPTARAALMKGSASPRGRVGVVIGTRPEAIKMAPVVHELARASREHPALTLFHALNGLHAVCLNAHLFRGLAERRKRSSDLHVNMLNVLGKVAPDLRHELAGGVGDRPRIVPQDVGEVRELEVAPRRLRGLPHPHLQSSPVDQHRAGIQKHRAVSGVPRSHPPA